MHIAFLTTEYPLQGTGSYGGIATSIKNLAIGLVNNGVAVTVFLISQKENRIINDHGVSIHLIQQKRYSVLSWFFYKKLVQRYINKQIKKLDIDLIESADWSGITAFMNFNCPLVIRFHGTDAYFCKLEGRKQKPKNFWLEKIALKTADHLVSVSHFTVSETKTIFNLKSAIAVIPNSVDTHQFIPDSTKEQPLKILYFGTLIRKKGVLDLMKIFNLVLEQEPLAQLRIVGANVVDIKTNRSTRELMVEQLSPRAKKSVEFLGKLDPQSMQEELAKASVVVLPSYAEALPMTWIESMAMEKALVTSNIGWASEVMDDETTGFIVHPSDHHLFTERIITLLGNRNLRETMGKNARLKVQATFSQKVVTQQNVDLYQCILDAR
jgi:glycosyltransferase involved in cell wall biosynthesis